MSSKPEQSEFNKNLNRLSLAQKYFSKFSALALKEGLQGMSEGASKRIPQLEAEKKVLESNLTSAMEKIREVSAVIEGNDLDLGTNRSQLEISSKATSQLEVVVREL